MPSLEQAVKVQPIASGNLNIFISQNFHNRSNLHMLIQKHLDIIQSLLGLRRPPNREKHKAMRGT